MKKIAWPIIDIVVISLLCIVFGILFLSQHAWGSWGDDSPGYIYTAGQFLHKEALVNQDWLVQSALDTFGDEKLARFAAPTHHTIISPSGWIASKYPIGLSWLMYIVASIVQNDEAIYLVVPLLAIGVVIGTYLAFIIWIKENLFAKRVGAIVASLSIGLSSLFANYAISQPMRDIPASFFMLWSVIVLGIAFHTYTGEYQVKLLNFRWISYGLLLVSGLLFGFGMNIRETNALLIVPLVIVWWLHVEKKRRLVGISIVMLGIMLAFSLSLWNSYQITAHKEKFRDRDITNIAITSNIDHVQSLSIENIYNNQGKFRPGVGGASQYWSVIQQYSLWPPFLFMAVLGLIILWFKQRSVAILFGSWFGIVFILFSMWINPYPRYILSLFPAIAVLGGYGTMQSLRLLKEGLKLSRWQWSIVSTLIIISFFATLQPSIAQQQAFIRNEQLVFKAISKNDLHTLKNITHDVKSKSIKDEPIILMLGQWKAGLSETMMTHQDGIRVIRYPSKANEQPNFEEFVQFIKTLQQTEELYLWYDSTANSTEQQFFTQFDFELIQSYSLSFQEGVEIYKFR